MPVLRRIPRCSLHGSPVIALPLQNGCASNLPQPILAARSAGGGGLGAIMLIQVLTSKIHRAQVTAGKVDYRGGLGIARDLMDKVGRLPHE